MSVSSLAAPLFDAMFRQNDIAMPLGMWAVAEAISGDASGGTVTVEVLTTGDELSRYICNVEWCQAASNNSGTGVFSMTQQSNTPIAGPAAIRGNQASVASAGLLDGVFFIYGNLEPRRNLFTHERQAEGISSLATLRFQTNVDTVEYNVRIGGYYWHRDALQSPGGLFLP